MTTLARPWLALLAVSALGCTQQFSDDENGNGIEGGGKADGAIAEGSELAKAILAVANAAPVDLLDETWGVGLDGRAARAIVASRDGEDGKPNTADDEPFTTLAQLDAASYVSAASFARLSQFVRGELVVRTRPLTDLYWQLLLPEGRKHVIESIDYVAEDAWAGMRIVTATQGWALVLASITKPTLRTYATALDSWMRANVEMDVMDLDGTHSLIGDPEIYWLTMLSREADNAVFGAAIGYFQLGCDMPDADADVRSFTDEAEATAAGCMLSDVNWSAHAMFDADRTPLEYDPAMEWSGY